MASPAPDSSRLSVRFFALAAALFLPVVSAFAAFGLTAATDYYQVDTGAGLVFKIRRTNNGSSTQSPGDIMSLVWNGVEYQEQSRGSQINSGFDYLYSGVSAVNVSAAVVNTNYVKITVQAGNLTHYYMARSGYPHIYMGTYFTSEPDVHGLVRYIFRIPRSLLPNGPTPSDISNNAGSLESGDICVLANGQTRSKHYSNMRLRDWSYIGATGTNIGMWVVRDNNEGASGGPFYRCLLNQGGDTNQEITYIVNYGEVQTEAWRFNILNSYTLVLTTGAPPSTSIDTSWFADMGLSGYVAPAGRGTLSGAGIANRDTNFAYTVGLSNTTAQYWADADSLTGAFSLSGIRPGSYTLSVYKNELSVYTTTVSISAGATTSPSSISLSADPARVVPVWRIGSWDGTPLEFLNGDKITTMHPSDTRITTWNPGTFIVDTSTAATGFPCYQWKNVNGQVIQFTLTASQLVSSTVRVGLTCAYSSGRPRIAVNSWSSALTSASSQPSTRSLTVGSYRGNNVTYTFSVPASAFVVGTNTLNIYPISGSGLSGYLNAGYSVDCVELTQTATQLDPPAAPATLSAVASSSARRIDLSWSAATRATTYNVFSARSASGPFTRVASGLATTTYSDTGLTDSGAYYYHVTGENSSGAGVPASTSVQLDPLTLTWSGASSAIWDTATANWTSSGTGSAAVYADGNGVTFDDTSSDLSVVLSGTLSPASVTINSTKNYSFTTGALSGTGSLAKSGTGTLTLSTAHAYTGGTAVSGGTLALLPGGSLAGTATLSNNATFRLAASGTSTVFAGNALAIHSGASATLSSAGLSNGYSGAVSGPANAALTLSGPVSFNATGTAQLSGFGGTVTVPSDSQLRFSSTSGPNGNGSANSTFVVNGTLNTRNAGGAGGVVLGALSGSGRIEGQTNTAAGTVTFFVGAKGVDTAFSGVIANGGAGTATLSKVGVGSLTLSGASAYTGATTVSAGSLYITGSLGATTVSVSSGATLGGTGSLGGNLALASGSRLALGFGSASAKGLSVSGTVTLAGNITVVPALLGGAISSGTYPLLTYTGSLSGSPTFTWLDTTGSGALATFDTSAVGIIKITLVAPPAAPADLLATAGNAQVSLTWSASSGATGYSVLRSTTSGSGYASLASGLSDPAYTDTGLTNGTTYYYVVAATNSAGTSANSDEDSAMPVLPLTPIESWRVDHFGQASATGTAANDADPDSDGLANLLEYALGSDPLAASSPAYQVQVANDTLQLAFTRVAAPSLSYTVQGSSDLATWSDLWSSTGADNIAGPVTVSDTSPLTTSPRRFLRLKVTTP